MVPLSYFPDKWLCIIWVNDSFVFSNIILLDFLLKKKKDKKWVVQPKTGMKGVPGKLEKRNISKTLMHQGRKSTNSNWSGRMEVLRNNISKKKTMDQFMGELKAFKLLTNI